MTSNFTYDPLYELAQVTQGSTTTESYTYDAVGNRLSSLNVSPYSYNTSNELTSKPGVTYTYDSNGNMLTKTDSSGTTTYSWDYENRLTSVILPGSGGTVSFKYDPFGRRIQKSSASATTNYVYDGADVLEEVDTGGNVLARYTQGPGIDEPLAEVRSGTTSYYEADGLGSITSLSDSSGALVNTYTYDSFGNLTASTGNIVNPIQYTGREFDSETGLFFYRARYYDPSTGRFLSEDPLQFGAGLNFYPYVDNHPTDLFDPFGLKASKCATRNCIQRALEALFPGVTASVGGSTGNRNPNGGHWNFGVQLTFPSQGTVNSFVQKYISQGQVGFTPFTRYPSSDKRGIGTTLHLELSKSPTRIVNPNGTITLTGKAHLDLYDPDAGLLGMAGHGIIDGLMGHIADLLRSNIDPANCPW